MGDEPLAPDTLTQRFVDLACRGTVALDRLEREIDKLELIRRDVDDLVTAAWDAAEEARNVHLKGTSHE
jgi:hypothetical protein